MPVNVNLGFQQSPLKKGLHIATAVGDHQDVHGVVRDSVDDAVWLEVDLSML